MKRKYITIILFYFISSCQIPSDQNNQKTTFTSFKISYTQGYGNEIGFFVDSNNLLFYPVDSNIILYTKLNDTLINKINGYIDQTIQDKTLQNRPSCCDDCEILAFQRVVNHDTFRLLQANRIDSTLMNIFISLYDYKKTRRLDTLNKELYSETRLTPPRKPEVKFQNRNRNESSR